MRPRVSVLMPVYDAAATLPAALESVLSQRGVELELIAVNDGSTDGGGELLEHFARRDRRLRVIHRGHDGLVAALNAGLAECRGRYVARMDADDLMLPGRLALQAAYLDNHPETAGVGCRARVEPRQAMTAGARRYLDWNNSLVQVDEIRRGAFIESPLIHPTLTLRRRVLTAAGGWRDFDGPEDYDLWLRLLFDEGLGLAKLPLVLHIWRDGPRRLTRTDPRYRAVAFRALKARYLARLIRERNRGYVVWGCGPLGKALIRVLRGEGLPPPRAIVEVHPGRIGEVIQDAPVIAVGGAEQYREALQLGAVGQTGARKRIREALAGLELVEGRDCWMTA